MKTKYSSVCLSVFAAVQLSMFDDFCTKSSISDEAAADVGAPSPPRRLANPQVEGWRHPVRVTQRAQRVVAGAGQKAMRQGGTLVVLSADDAWHQREGRWVGQHAAGVPVEGGQGAVAGAAQVAAQLKRPLVKLVEKERDREGAEQVRSPAEDTRPGVLEDLPPSSQCLWADPSPILCITKHSHEERP